MLLLLTVQQTVAKMSGRPAERLSFEAVADIVFGIAGRRLVQVCILVLQMGVCALIISFLRTDMHYEFDGSNRYAMLALVVAICIGLSLLPDLPAMWPVSLAGNVGLLLAAFSAIGVSLYEDSRSGEKTASPAPTPSVANCAALFAAAFYSSEGIGLVLPIGNALSRGFADRYPSILCWTTVTAVCLYLVIGASVGSAFPEKSWCTTSLSAHLSRTYSNAYWALLDWITSASLLASFPLQLVPVTQVLEAQLDIENKGARAGLRVGLCVCCALTGLFAPKDTLLDIIGALTSTTLTALPYAMHAKLNIAAAPEDKKPLLFIVDIVVLFMCLLVMVLGLSSAFGLMGDKTKPEC